MSGIHMALHHSSGSEPTIDSVDAFVRQLYRRARDAGPDFRDIAGVLRSLHTVLKHARIEADDSESLLNGGDDDGIYARQFAPLMRDCDLTLRQLDIILEKYGSPGGSASTGDDEGTQSTGRQQQQLDMTVEERGKFVLIQRRLAEQKTSIDMLLDSVQLQNPAAPKSALESDDNQQLDRIKDQVDAIAARLYQQRRMTSGSDTEEDLWMLFQTELERAGFASDVLQRNKEVLRAYMRQLDEQDKLENGAPASVRGLLKQEANGGHRPYEPLPPPTVTPSSYPSQDIAPIDPGRAHQDLVGDNDGASNTRPFEPSIQHALQPYQPPPQPTVFYNRDTGLSYDQDSSSDSSDSEVSRAPSEQALVISTRDLIAFDHREADVLQARMNSMHLSPALPPPPQYSYSPGTSPNMRYLAGQEQPLRITTSQPPPPLLTASYPNDMASSPNSQQQFGTSPRYVPSLPPYPGLASPTSTMMTPPPAYASSPAYSSMPAVLVPVPPATTEGQSPNMTRQYSRLAPDSRGQEIPLEAQWTRIKRTLVSPEVLEKARVRYEARPEFVAILGVLSREQIAEFARQSAEVRKARLRAHGPGSSQRQTLARHRDETHGSGRHRQSRRHGHRRDGAETDSESSSDDSDDPDDEHERRRNRTSDRTDAGQNHGRRTSEDEKGTQTYPIIVPSPNNAPGNHVSPAATVMPKPILKNRNPNRVKFDKDGPYETDSRSRDRSRYRSRSRSRSRHRSRSRRGQDRDRDRDRDRGDSRERDTKPESSRNRSRDRGHHRNHHHGHRRHHHGRDRDRERDRDIDRDRRDRDRDRDKDADRERDRSFDDRTAKKKAIRETLGAVGLGGAAASLLTVLTEATNGF